MNKEISDTWISESQGMPPVHHSEFSLSKIALIQLLCTIVIVLAGYVFTNQIILSTNDKIESLEYSKVGGEENYKLLREIQKDQVDSYIQDYSKKDPEYMKQLRAKLWLTTGSGTDSNLKTLTQSEIATLKSDTPVFWNTGSKVLLIEYSDFKCEHCRDFHASKSISDIVESSSGSVAMLFKNIPSTKSQDSLILSKAGRCVYTLTGAVSYKKYIDLAFQGKDVPMGSGALDIAQSFWLKALDLELCLASPDTKISLDKEIWQSIYLWVKATPSTVVLNSVTGKYQIVEGNVNREALENTIDSIAEMPTPEWK